MKLAIATPKKWQFKRVLEIREVARGIYDAWGDYQENTCVSFNGGYGYSPKSFYQDEGYEIISYKEFLRREKMSRYKVGDILVNEDGAEKMVLGVHKKLYHLSPRGDNYTDEELKKWGYYLKGETTEVLGKKYKTKELKKRLKRLKEVK